MMSPVLVLGCLYLNRKLYVYVHVMLSTIMWMDILIDSVHYCRCILGDTVALASTVPPLQIFISSYLDALFAGYPSHLLTRMERNSTLRSPSECLCWKLLMKMI
jgi:hypothetical protein